MEVSEINPPPGVSVVIVTRNGAERLPATLRCLMQQEVPTEIPWEVVIVDNGSTDNTRQTILETWQSEVSLKIISDPVEGVAYVRIRGVSEAAHEIILYIDDDNRPDPHWVQTVSLFFQSHPEAGMLGGKTTLEADTAPPAWFPEVAEAYAIGDQSDREGDITSHRGYLWGAGMSFRKSVFLSILQSGYVPMLTGRKKGKLAPGEDSEMSYLFAAAGYRIWYLPGLHLQHYMPPGRLEWSYACKLFQGIGESHFILDLYSNILHKRKYVFLRIYLSVLYQFMPLLARRCFRLIKNREGDTGFLRYLMKQGTLLCAIRLLPTFHRKARQIRTLAANLRILNP